MPCIAGSISHCVAAGPAIGILDETGKELAAHERGEICIRGPNVTLGYENNPEANRQAFTNGWFRTGDQGYLDEEGYLFITGRLKEIINRGGEKISPREVDEILLDHPGVQQVVTFALPHPRLGEEVAAAVVLRDGQKVDEKELRRFALDRLAEFRGRGEHPRKTFHRLRRSGLLDDIQGLVFVEGDERAPLSKLVNTGIQRMVQDLDELPHPIIGLGLIEPPSRKKGPSPPASDKIDPDDDDALEDFLKGLR